MSYSAALRAALAPTREPLDVAGFYLSRLTAAGWCELVAWRRANPGRPERLAAKLVCLAVVGEDGRPALSDGEAAELPADVFDRIGRRAAALNSNGRGPTPSPGPVVEIDGPRPREGLSRFNAGRVPIYLRHLREHDRRTYQKTFGRARDDWKAAVWAAARSIVNPAGGRVLDEDEIWKADGGAVDAIVRRLARLNGFI